ncbi:MAG: DUF3846 domain-containing protein [Clostridia bacterium]|nr:DUF3846 domain-containing protein [Clostridia bacterium]
MKKDIIKVLVKQPGRPLQLGAIPNELCSFQKAVGGYVEVVSLRPDLAMIVNEEGKLRGLPKNFWMEVIGDYIVGTAVFVGVNGDEFDDVPVTLSGLYSMMSDLWRK